MVYQLKPLELTLEFEDRIYELGDIIDIELSLAPNGDIEVREGRVDLLCEEIYTSASRGAKSGGGRMLGGRYAVTRTLRQGQRGTGQTAVLARRGRGPSARSEYVMSPVVSQRTESYIHSSLVFLTDTTLSSGRPGTYDARLQIQPSPPTHLDEARDVLRDASESWSFKWRLVASVNIVRGRDPRRQRRVKLLLPQVPVGRGAKPKVSTPKKRTGPSR